MPVLAPVFKAKTMIMNLVIACLMAATVIVLTGLLIRVAIAQYREIKCLRREIKKLEQEEQEMKRKLNEKV